MNTNSASVSRSWRTPETKSTQAARDQNAKSIVGDVRFKVSLNRTERQLMRALLLWHDPLTGYLKSRTRALNLMDKLDISESTLRRARRTLLRLGLIVSYSPGDGRIASTYVIARSWQEADAAVVLRESQGEDAPYFPELVDRTPSAVDKRPELPAGAEEVQEQEQEPAAEERRRERRERARFRQNGYTGPVPPTLPDASALIELRELAERKADGDVYDEIKTRGLADVRAALRPTRAAGAA